MDFRPPAWARRGRACAAWGTDRKLTTCFATSARPSPTRPTSTRRAAAKRPVFAALLRNRQNRNTNAPTNAIHWELTASRARRKPTAGSSDPHKKFSWLQTAHHRWNGCRIISSRPWVGLREGEGVFNTPSFFVCLSAAGLHQQTLQPFLLQLVQVCEHGWVH